MKKTTMSIALFLLILFFSTSISTAQKHLYKVVKQELLGGVNDPLVDSFETTYSYYSNGLVFTETKLQLLGNGYRSYTDTFDYTKAGLIKSQKKYYWSVSEKKWRTQPAMLRKYIYKDDTVLIRREDSFNPYGSSPEYYSEDYIYNNLGLRILTLTSRKDIRTTYSYNSDGKLKESVREVYHNGTWVGNYKFINNYDSIDRIISVMNYSYSWQTNTWNEHSEDEYFFIDGKVSEKHENIKLGIGWQKRSKIYYTYNADGTLKETLKKNKSNNGYYDAERYKYFYKNMRLGLGALTKENLVLYPNPTSGKFTVELASNKSSTINITDITGKQVFTSKASDILDIDLSHLQKGVYIVNVQANNGVKTQKVIVQ